MDAPKCNGDSKVDLNGYSGINAAINSTSRDYGSTSTEKQDFSARGNDHTFVNTNSQSVDNSLNLRSDVVIPDRITKRQMLLLFQVIYGNFWVSACYSLIAPFFPQEAEKKGASQTVYGFIFGVFQLVVFVSSPIYGYIMPVVTPRFLIIAGLFVSSCCSVLFGVLCYVPEGYKFIVLAFAIRILEALGTAAYYVAALTTAATEFPTRVATVLSILESTNGIGMIIGPAIGGTLVKVGGYELPFVTLGGILAVGTILATFVAPHVEPVDLRSDGSLKKLMKCPSFYIYVASFIYGFSIIGFTEGTLSPHLEQFHLSIDTVSLLFTIPAGLYAITAPIWGTLCDRIPRPQLFCFVGSAFCAVSFLLVGPVPFLQLHTELWLVILALVALGVGIGGVLISSFILLLADAVKLGLPDNIATYALVSGIFSSMSSLGAFIGPSVGGILVDNLGYEKGTIVYLAVCIFMTVVLFFHLMLSSKSKSRRERDGTDEERQPILQEEPG